MNGQYRSEIHQCKQKFLLARLDFGFVLSFTAQNGTPKGISLTGSGQSVLSGHELTTMDSISWKFQ
jgi:hypothetical protein